VTEGPDVLGGAVGRIVLAENLAVLASLPEIRSTSSTSIRPSTPARPRLCGGCARCATRTEATASVSGGRRYRTIQLGEQSYLDIHDDYLDFLEPRLVEIRRVLRPSGTLYLHLDPREVHYAKVLCDAVFGRKCFLNEVIWQPSARSLLRVS